MPFKNSADESVEIAEYNDEDHAEDLEGVFTNENGYKYRLLNNLVVPPYVTPARYELARRLRLRRGDICYTSYPKSGSTWLANILVHLVNDGVPPEEGTLRSHLHWVESSWTYPRSESELNDLPSPRIFKSHMPCHMCLGEGPGTGAGKYIYIARNPKDVAVSYFYFESDKAWSGHYNGTWEQWLEMFILGKVQRGDWFDHVLSWWEKRDQSNLLFLKYEDLVRRFPEQLEQISDFLGRRLTEGTLERIRLATSFDRMKDTPFANMHEIADFKGFFRKGKIGSWAEQFTADEDARFQELIDTRLSGTGLEFEYE